MAAPSAPSTSAAAQLTIDAKGASVDPKDYTWGSPSYAVLCQQFFQLQLLYSPFAQQNGCFPGAFPAMPFTPGFLSPGMMGLPQPAGPLVQQQAQQLQVAAPSAVGLAPTASLAAQTAPSSAAQQAQPSKASKAKAPKATKASKQQQPRANNNGAFNPDEFELDADEIRKLLEDADSFLPDLEEGSLSDNASLAASASNNSSSAVGSPRDSGCNNLADPFRTEAMDLDAFDLGLNSLQHAVQPLVKQEPVVQPQQQQRMAPAKASSGDLNNMKVASAAKLAAGLSRSGKPPRPSAAKASGGVQKVSAGGSRAGKGAAPHASTAAVSQVVAAAEEVALADFSKLLGDEGHNRFPGEWDMDLVDTIDFANPFSTPVTVIS